MREGSGRSAGAARVVLRAALVLAPVAAFAAPPEFARAIAAAESGDRAACSAEFERVGASATQHGLARRAFYGSAVCAAQAGEVDRAFGLLERAIALGFHDDNRFYFDPRLAAVRVDARWPALEAKFVAARGAWRASLEPELARLAAEDQDDRKPGAGEIDWEGIAPRDRARVARVKEIVAAGGAKLPDDLYHAALVLQHGEEVAEFQMAHDLALRAAEADADLTSARWLAAAALDRLLVRSGKPQKYGTQMIREDGRWVVAEVDPAVTDAERALWEVPPLAESRRIAAELNAKPAVTIAPEAPVAPSVPPPKPPPATGPA